MRDNFNKCLDMLLKHEGGYIHHPQDPGGQTNLGVTKATYDEFYGGDATEEVMRAITVGDVAPIYLQNYWDKCLCHSLASGLDWAVFDWAVNSGPSRAGKALQKAVGAVQDGHIGPMTMRRTEQHDPRELIEYLYTERDSFYRSLDTFDSFGKGWIRRNNETRDQALEMLA